jgi:hypothetical protein
MWNEKCERSEEGGRRNVKDARKEKEERQIERDRD